MSAWALPPAAPGPWDVSVWSYLDFSATSGDPPASGAESAQHGVEALMAGLAAPNPARRLVELCLQHVLLRELVQEESARTTTAVGPSDAELVLQAEQNVPGAFEVLMERYLSIVVGTAYSQLSDIEAAKDVAQDTFFEAIRTLPLLREREKFGNWVYGIARRKASYQLRRRRMHKAAVDYRQQVEKAQPGPDDPSAPLVRRERAEEIRSALQQLPEIYREILVLKYLDGRSYDEIAAILGITLAAVDKRLMRGKSMLKETLRHWTTE